MHEDKCEAYFAALSPELRQRMLEIRRLIQSCAPQLEETFGYGMPAFKAQKIIVYYAVFKNHIGLFPGKAAVEWIRHSWPQCVKGKATIQIQHTEAIPEDLIAALVNFRMDELTKSNSNENKD
jgi:uncharacterized protein YdhG (YjbR/CyaY superfamily)